MDWLNKCDGVIHCAKRPVLLTSPHGDKIEFVATLPSAADSVVNQLEGSRLEDVRVVCEIPDVFPNDLPGMPPDRDTEFVIELLPLTAPISKRQYRMVVNELEELKKQLKEFLDKDFIHPSTSP
jgi:hypothetical protein